MAGTFQGPITEHLTRRVCTLCVHFRSQMRSRSYRPQPGGSTDYFYCAHPDMPRQLGDDEAPGRYIRYGSGSCATPHWCPYLQENKS